ncbi:rhox homeobox family member 2-like [Neofelis nebulosa]|uniref:rhox homeobox family member 2-like n=1 Tax=Neofelis nebulosa TaxID=61452 RepID=UPI00272CFCEA|nr:rhox homeobox family member 2-like [Neofelis nebulosa]
MCDPAIQQIQTQIHTGRQRDTMDPFNQFKREVTGFPSLGVDEDREELRETKQVGMSLTRDQAAEEAGAEFAPQQQAAGIQIKKEGDSHGDDNHGDGDGEEGADDVGAGYPCPAGRKTRDVKPEEPKPEEPKPEEPRPEGRLPSAAAPAPGPARGGRWPVGRLIKFTPQQMRQLESLFQTTHYPSITTRQELSRFMNVPVARLQVWFKNRRAKLRRQRRALRHRNMPPMATVPPSIINVGRPYRGIFISQLNFVWIFQEPMMPGPPCPPMQPFPPMFLFPQPWFRLAFPPYGCPPPFLPSGYLPPFPPYGCPPLFLPSGYLPFSLPFGCPPPFPPYACPPMAHPGAVPPLALL